MALTQVSSGGIKDSEVKNADMADDSVGIAELSATGTAGNTTYLRGDNTWTVPPDTNTVYTHPNHSGEVTSVADGATTITDDVVDEANLKISNAGSDGQYLQKQSGNTGGLTWATVTAGGGGATGTDYNDNVKVRWGTGNDLEIYHDGSDSKIVDSGAGTLNVHSSGFNLLNVAGNENFATFTNNGSVELYYDNSLKFKTNNAGAIYYGTLNTSDTGKATYGDGDDLQIYHNGSHSFIKDTGTGNLQMWTNQLSLLDSGGTESMIQAIENGAVELYYNGAKKFETNQYGWKSIQHMYFDDSHKVQLGSSQDLEIYHDGTHSYLKNSTNNLKVLTSSIVFKNAADSETLAQFTQNGSCDLYYDNAKKLESIATGVNVTGGIRLGGNNAANECDDYEEGIFDAVVSVDSGTGTYSYRSLKYIKIGHLCTVMGSVDMAFSVSDPGRVDIGGFPFAMVNAHEDVGFMCPAYNTTAAAGCDAGKRRFSMYAASSHIRMYANNYVSDGEIGTTNRVQFHISFTYPTS